MKNAPKILPLIKVCARLDLACPEERLSSFGDLSSQSWAPKSPTIFGGTTVFQFDQKFPLLHFLSPKFPLFLHTKWRDWSHKLGYFEERSFRNGSKRWKFSHDPRENFAKRMQSDGASLSKWKIAFFGVSWKWNQIESSLSTSCGKLDVNRTVWRFSCLGWRCKLIWGLIHGIIN